MSEVTPTYSGIDSSKFPNKESLLELSIKIKEYIDQNAGGSSVSLPFDIIEYHNDISDYTTAELQQIYNLANGVANTRPCVILA